ncbi:MAG: amidinotransferase [Acetobacteraceae bacterium]|nr:amidinotransferase [Acetobacteraceae bacterium]
MIKSMHDYYGILRRIPPAPRPPHEDPESLERFWGAAWGADDDVGRLRVCLVGRPPSSAAPFERGAYDPSTGCLVDPEGRWYWRSDRPPDVELINLQHQGLRRALEAEGVRVEVVETPQDGRALNAMFVRDQAAVVRGGAIVSRMGPLMRRGEEIYMARKLAALGVPILRTISGTGLFEGGSFARLDRSHAAVAESCRTNPEAIRQISEVLAPMGIEVITVPVTGYSLHIDGCLVMVDRDKALLATPRLPFFLLQRLEELGIVAVEAHPQDDFFAVNCLAVRPGRVLMCDGAERTAELLAKRGVEVVTVDYSEVKKAGGGIHCSTLPVLRDPAP